MAILSDDEERIKEKPRKNPVIKAETIAYDRVFENSIRPKSFDTYVGQTALKETLKISIEAAKKRNTTLDHVLFYGPPGLGKTTLAGIIAEELGTSVKITSAPSFERPRDIIGVLMSLKEGEVLFIDEIHRLNTVTEEILYPAMEDFYLDMMTGKTQTVKTMRIKLPKLTLVGATTKAGGISSPLRDRFGFVHRLQFYSVDELTQVILKTAKILNIAAPARPLFTPNTPSPLSSATQTKNGNSEGKTQLIKSSKPSAAPAAACGPKRTSPKQRIAVTATKKYLI